MTELHHFHPARKGSGSLRPFPIYPLYTQAEILSLDKPIADCFLFRPWKSRKSAGNAVIPRLSAHQATPSAQTPQRSFRGTAAGIHSPSPAGSHTAAHARKRGVFQMGVVSVPSTCAAWTGTSARAAVRRAFFAIFAWTEGTSERSREPSERRRAPCASPFRGAAAP